MSRAIAILAVLASAAHAGTRVVVLTDRDAMPAALQVALADRHVEVSVEPPPQGALRLDRAAAAQHAAIASGADVGLWLDSDSVWAVSADGRFVRHAPIPADATPDAIAATANELLAEVWTPVHVTVTVTQTPPAPAVVAPPALAIVRPAVATPIEDQRANRFLLELGVTASPATYGVEAELTVPVVRHARFGAYGGINQLFDGVGELALEPVLLFDTLGHGKIPSVMVSVRWGAPL
jgi:hypothetical protein